MSYPLMKRLLMISLILISYKVTDCWKKHEFIDRLEEGSNLIFAKTLRGMANFIIAGNSVSRVIKQLPNFKAKVLPKVPTGPMNIGTLDNRIVIQDPFMTSTRYIMGYRGDAFLYAGFVYCPSNVRHYQVIGNENFVNCGNVWSILGYEALSKAA